MKYLFWDLVLNNPKRIEVYLSGCLQHCEGCHNPESWDFNQGYGVNGLFSKLEEYKMMYDDIWILGGEPLDQNLDELSVFLNELILLDKIIWLWTSFDFEKVYPFVKDRVHFLKCGKYDKNLSPYMTEYGFELASSNQKIYKMF